MGLFADTLNGMASIANSVVTNLGGGWSTGPFPGGDDVGASSYGALSLAPSSPGSLAPAGFASPSGPAGGHTFNFNGTVNLNGEPADVRRQVMEAMEEWYNEVIAREQHHQRTQ
jgi:hypothetical protein